MRCGSVSTIGLRGLVLQTGFNRISLIILVRFVSAYV